MRPSYRCSGQIAINAPINYSITSSGRASRVDRVCAVLAAFDMAAERRRAAALDGTHHLHLVEADVSGIGTTPRRSVVAEDIRDLQCWTGHRCGLLRRRLLFPALLGLLARLRQQVERALDAGDHAGGDAGVARRGVQFVVTERARVIMHVLLTH